MAGSSMFQVSLLVATIVVAGCVPQSAQPIQTQAKADAWGPFARQCSITRLIYLEPHRQLSPIEKDEVNTQCVGFYAQSQNNGTVQITASTGGDNPASLPIISRLVRDPNGTTRTAGPTESGSLAYGSDQPELAGALARDLGLTRQQMTEPGDRLRLPIRLQVPFPIDVTTSCRPNGESTQHGRAVLVLDCAADQTVTTDRLQAQIHLAGRQEVDVATGVRLSARMNGWMDRLERRDATSDWRQARHCDVWYSKTTEFE